MDREFKTRLEINVEALRHNFDVIKKQLKPETKIMGVVKSSAYGADIKIIAKELLKYGVTQLAVAYTDEGIELRKAGITCPILIFYPEFSNFSDYIKYELTPSIYNFSFLNSLIEQMKCVDTTAFPIHLKLNTGMNRVGFNESDYEAVKSLINKCPNLKVAGIYSHLAASGSPIERKFTLNQIAKFKHAIKVFESCTDENLVMHLCNSDGILNYPEAEMNMVRTGIALYGYGKSMSNHDFIPIASFKTSIIHINSVNKGDSVGYGRNFKPKEKRKIATVPIGYADGISRAYGNANGIVKINNQLAPIVGNVCMNSFMIDVTEIKCNVNDEVLVFGEGHSALEFDVNNKSIPYELITRIAKRIPRVFINMNQ